MPAKPSLGQKLLGWYEAERRDLPWRALKSDYAIWVSEIMLQQTTVAAVVPRFENFLAVFPDMESLAGASEEAVLAELQGLGYYRRFRSMKKAAELIVAEHGGNLPRTRKELEALPGIGSYTAGAILSIAHDLDEAAVDGNVIRVITRLMARPGPHETPARKRELGEIVLELMPRGRASDFNQALFDLGARICLPKNPNCETCPLNRDCQARLGGRIDEFPELAKRRPGVEKVVVQAMISRGEQIFFERRAAAEERMPGFLQLPEVWCDPGANYRAALRESFRERQGLELGFGAELAQCRHSITHHKLDCRLLSASFVKPAKAQAETHWLKESELANWPISTISMKLLKKVAWLHPGQKDASDRARPPMRQEPRQ